MTIDLHPENNLGKLRKSDDVLVDLFLHILLHILFIHIFKEIINTRHSSMKWDTAVKNSSLLVEFTV